MAGKIFKDIPRMMRNLIVVEQYNNFKQMNIKDEIYYIRNKVENLINIKDTKILIEEFIWCSNIINKLYNEVDGEFKKFFIEQEKKEFEE